ncbi:hypothetical protein GEMRC1_004163 [Eukaryota sp. GEM-RC1]
MSTSSFLSNVEDNLDNQNSLLSIEQDLTSSSSISSIVQILLESCIYNLPASTHSLSTFSLSFSLLFDLVDKLPPLAISDNIYHLYPLALKQLLVSEPPVNFHYLSHYFCLSLSPLIQCFERCPLFSAYIDHLLVDGLEKKGLNMF